MPFPRMQPVDSSAIARIGYDPEVGEVYVEFHVSGVYAYEGVPARVYEEFAGSESKGTFVNETIKPRYLFRKL